MVLLDLSDATGPVALIQASKAVNNDVNDMMLPEQLSRLDIPFGKMFHAFSVIVFIEYEEAIAMLLIYTNDICVCRLHKEWKKEKKEKKVMRKKQGNMPRPH